MFILGLFLYLFIIVLTTLFGGKLGIILDPISLIFILVSNAAVLVSTKSINDFWNGVKILITNDIDVKEIEIYESIKAFNLLYKSALGISLIGVIIGIIKILHTLSDISTMGPAIAVALITVFYSTTFAFVILLPGKYMLDKILRGIDK